MPQPCQALHGLLKAIVREYRRILGSSLAGIYLVRLFSLADKRY